jgi:hypothetical protein
MPGEKSSMILLVLLVLACSQCSDAANKAAAQGHTRVIVVFDDASLQTFAKESLAEVQAVLDKRVTIAAGITSAPRNPAVQQAVAEASSLWQPAAAAFAERLLARARSTRINATTGICYGLLLKGCSYVADTLQDVAALEHVLSSDNRVAAVYPVVRFSPCCRLSLSLLVKSVFGSLVLQFCGS